MARKPVAFLAGFVRKLFFGTPFVFMFAGSAVADTVTFKVQLPADKVSIERGGTQASVVVDERGYTRLQEEGSPALPYRVVNLLLPQGHDLHSWTYAAAEPALLSAGIDVEPAPPMLSEQGKPGVARALASFSKQPAVYPEVVVRYLATGYLHGRGIASFAVFPLRVRDGSLEYIENIELKIETEPLRPEKQVVVRERYRAGFQEQLNRELSRFVDNVDMTWTYTDNSARVTPDKRGFLPTQYPSLEGSPVDYVIITTDDLADEYQRLADFKTDKGVPTVVRTVSWIAANTLNGSDIQETMRFFIRDAYAKWGIKYVLFGGDTDILPARYAISRFYLGGVEIPVDMYFTGLDGTWNDDHDAEWGEGVDTVTVDNPDLYVEVYNGRIPVSDPADVDAVIDKIIGYESGENLGYTDKHLMLAEVLFPLGWTSGDPISQNGADFIEYMIATAMQGNQMDIVRMYETPGPYPGAVQESKQAVIDSMNSGFNHVNHIGHGFRFNMSVGNGSILGPDADALTNTGRWFNLYMLNCTAAAYDYFCLGEHYLQNHNGGAVSVIGANESAFPNASSHYLNEYHELVFEDDFVHIGQAFADSRLPRTPIALAGDNVDLWTHYIYTIMADPEMPFYTGPADTLSVFHVANVATGPNSILVNVTDTGVPRDSAVVCMSKGIDDYQFVATNSLGNAIVNFTPESPGSILVVVTARNYARHESYITVDPSPNAYVSFSSMTVDDDSIGGSAGNGDGMIDAGETIDFTLEMMNSGTSPSDSVWVKLRSDDPNVTVLDSICEVGVIGAGGAEFALDPVRVLFDMNTPDETAVEFELDIQEAGGAFVIGSVSTAGGPWSDTFSKEVHAPELAKVQLRVDDDAPLGDGSGFITSGEEFKLYYELKNRGTGPALGLTIDIVDVDDGITFTDSMDTYPDLGPFQQSENVAGMQMSEVSTFLENRIAVTITDNYGRTMLDTIELRIPQPATSLSFDSKLGPDRLEVMWNKSTSPDAAYYNVYSSTTQGGPYTRVNPDPVEHGTFVHTGLTALTTYYYVVRAIDNSGNLSFQTSEGTAATNAPIMAGFPITLEDQTTSDPVVGDIDGDGDNEIVVGNWHVYAWHHDGIEVRDGDGDPQTWGVLNTLGGEITASIALGNIDNKPGLDIVACDLDSMWVMCMDHNGNMLPGWPQKGEHDFRSPATTGDINADGFTDVIAVDTYGTIYAWHRDGTEILDGDADSTTTGVFFRTGGPISFHYQGVALCDLDSDGKDEIIFGSRDHNVYALNDDGSSVPGWPFTMPNEMAGSPATGDIDNDGLPEVVVRSTSSEVYLLNHDATVWGLGWPRYISINEPYFRPSFALADFDNDNDLEIVVAHHNTIEARLYILQHNGSNYPGWPIIYNPDDNTESSPLVADINGDGSLDIVLGDESRFVYAWDINGAMLPGFPLGTADAIRATPAIDDVDGDGDPDMVVYSWDQRLYVYDLGGVWNDDNAPWKLFQGNFMRSGKHGAYIPTGIAGASFTFSVGRDGITLAWLFGSPTGERFNILKSSSDAEGTLLGQFSPIASDVAVEDGLVRFSDTEVEMGQYYVYKLESVDNPGDEFLSDAIYVPVTKAALAQNYPNPFNPVTRIQYFVPEFGPSQHVSITVYDVTGARVRTLVNEKKEAGRHSVEWNGRDDRGMQVSSGIYFYRMETKGFSASKKMLLLK